MCIYICAASSKSALSLFCSPSLAFRKSVSVVFRAALLDDIIIRSFQKARIFRVSIKGNFFLFSKIAKERKKERRSSHIDAVVLRRCIIATLIIILKY